MKFRFILSIALYLCGVSVQTFGADALAWTAATCGGCHALQDPLYDQKPVDERANRKAPPLFYAGNKFRRDWLVSWLQKPDRIRPAGYFPPAHVVSGPDGDIVDETSLQQHPDFTQQEAVRAADYLMSLTPYTARLDEIEYAPGSISWKMGNLNFGKFRGCDACHRDAPDFGGVSGPELYTAWDRLQPKFIFSFISNPAAWDAHTLMPHVELNPAVVKKLADYLKVNGEDEE
ncbi:MAG: cytochrome C [Spongiibacteraceae bacterium]|nr:cytochrome C [Spongiibacteraceae bacterium]